jgi:hypothetical protein
VALVQQVRDEVPLGAALRAVSLARSTWHYRVRHWQPYEARYRALRAPLERIARTLSSFARRGPPVFAR